MLAALALSACGETPAEREVREHVERGYAKVRTDEVRRLMQQGLSKSQAEARFDELAAGPKLNDEERRAMEHRLAQREAEVEALRTDACQRAPYLDRCR